MFKERRDSVRLDGSATLVARVSVYFESAKILSERAIILSHVQRSLRQIVESVGNIAGDLELLTHGKSLFEIGSRVVKVSFGEIGISDAVQTQAYEVLIPHITLDLQRFLQKFQCLVILAVVVVGIPQVHQCVAEALGVSNLAL